MTIPAIDVYTIHMLHTTKVNARLLVRKALYHGHLQKPKSCQRCLKPSEKIVAHHKDYNRPLSVEWLCEPCHHLHHSNHARMKNVKKLPFNNKRVGILTKWSTEERLYLDLLAIRRGMDRSKYLRWLVNEDGVRTGAQKLA